MKFSPKSNEENPHRTVNSEDDKLHDERGAANEPRFTRIVNEIFGIILHFVHGSHAFVDKAVGRVKIELHSCGF